MKKLKGKNIPSDEGLLNGYKLEYCKWCITLAFSVLMYVIVADVILKTYHPDITRILQFGQKNVIQWSFPVTPEPEKSLLYIAALAVFAISIPGFYYLTNRYLKDIDPKRVRLLYRTLAFISIACIIFITYKGLIAPNPYYVGNSPNFHDHAAKTNADFYFVSTFIYDNFIWYIFILFPVILLYFLYNQKIPRKVGEVIDKGGQVLTYVFCGAIIVMVFFISAFKFPYSAENKYDFNNVYYSVVQVYQGTPMLVDHFMNTYGLYPHFVVPVMKLFGLSVLSFSSIMGCLVSLCFLFLLVFLIKTVASKLLILFGFTSVFFISYVYGPIATPNFDPYFGGTPIRWILPISLMLYAVLYLEKRSKKMYFFSFIFFPLGILWCPDFGMASFLDLLAFYSFLEFENRNLKRIIKKIISHGFFAVLGVAVTFSAYAIIIKIAYGKVPDLFEMFDTIRIEALIGRGMLPMPTTLHPWMLVVIMYLTGLVYSVYHIINKKVSPRSAIVFLLTVIGMASFSYYLKRSHNWNLFSSNFECFLLLAVFADDLLKIIKKRKLFFAPFALLVFFLSFSLFQTVYAYQPIINLMFDKEDKEKNRGEQERIVGNAEFIHTMTHDKEKVVIFCADCYQGLYYGLSNTAAAINPGFQDMRLISDYTRIQFFLIKNETTKIFFDPYTFRFCDLKIPMILSSIYNVSKVEEPTGSIMLLSRKKENNNSNFILKQDNSSLHELFDKDFANKLLYAEGEKGAVALGKRFFVEAIFRPVDVPSLPYANWQSVFSNAQGNNGMALVQNTSGNKTEYVFCLAGNGIKCPVVLNKWNYLAFEVDNSRVRAYANGQPVGSVDIKVTYSNSGSPFYVGNYSLQGGFFFGDIKELKISNNVCDPKEMSIAWNKVKNIEE